MACYKSHSLQNSTGNRKLEVSCKPFYQSLTVHSSITGVLLQHAQLACSCSTHLLLRLLLSSAVCRGAFAPVPPATGDAHSRPQLARNRRCDVW